MVDLNGSDNLYIGMRQFNFLSDYFKHFKLFQHYLETNMFHIFDIGSLNIEMHM